MCFLGTGLFETSHGFSLSLILASSFLVVAGIEGFLFGELSTEGLIELREVSRFHPALPTFEDFKF